MTINQAKTALWEGHKLAHRFFEKNEYAYMDEDGNLRDEKGTRMHRFWEVRESLAWQHDWKVYEEESEVDNG